MIILICMLSGWGGDGYCMLSGWGGDSYCMLSGWGGMVTMVSTLSGYVMCT